MEDMLSIARRYLAARKTTASHEANILRVAGRCRQVTAERVNLYLRTRLDSVSSNTVRHERSMILSIWRWAYDESIVDTAPRGIMRVKSVRKPTRAWTTTQCRLLVEGTRNRKGRLRSGVSLSLFLRAWILLGYEAGARRGDLFSLRAEHLDGDSLRWTQSKTGDPIAKVLSPACVEAVKTMLMLSRDGTILGWACGKRQSMRVMKDHILACGLDGTSKWLRRSGATHCEMAQPGAGRLHLGHRSPALFDQAYADWTQLRTKTPKTPSLVD